MNRKLTSRVGLFAVGIATSMAVVAGCSSDDAGNTAGTGGAGGTAGGGAGGKSTGGSGTGGKGSGGLGGTGGKGSGGQGTGGVLVEAGADGGECTLPRHLVYRTPGCGAAATPVCISPPTGAVDAGVSEACGCDGTRTLGGNGFTKPYRHLGECTDASVPDSGSDSGKDAH